MSTAHDEADPVESKAARPPSGEPELRSVGPYELKKKIGAGGMGTVYLAHDTRLKRTVALKILPPDKAENPTLVRRFKSEAEKAAQLQHENIVGVYEAGEADGYSFIALEYIEGIDVHDLVNRRGVLPFKRSLDVIKQVARALEHASAQSIVHRDIKPSNLMIRRDGVVKLADMGLARSMDETTETGITRAGTTVGTVDYMAPEQARDSKLADIRSDIYSLGCTWYHMLTGQPPFPDGSLTNKLRAHAHTAPPDPRDKNPNVPEAAVAVLHRMLAKDPNQRYQTAQELLEDLDGAHLSRKAVTQNDIAALADPQETTPPKPRDKQSRERHSDSGPHEKQSREQPRDKNSDSGPRALPPKERGTEDGEPSDGGGFKQRVLIWGIVAGVALAAYFGLGYVIKNYGSGFDSVAYVAPGPEDLPGEDGTVGPGQNDPNRVGGGNTIPAPVAADNTTPNRTTKISSTTVGGQNLPPGPGMVINPERIAQLRERDEKQLPKWTEERLPTAGLTTVTVGAGPGAAANLNAALASLPAAGGIVELHGAGPFVLQGTPVARPLVVIKAAAGPRPCIVLAAGATPEPKLLHLQNGRFEIEGIDIALAAEQFATSDPLVLVGVTAGHLALRDCSVSLRGSRSGPTTAIQMEGEYAPPGQAATGRSLLLLERVLVRGQGLRGVDLNVGWFEAILRESLLASGPASTVQVGGSFTRIPGMDRAIRCFSSTLCSTQNAFLLDSAESDNPVPVTISLLNSLVAADDAATQPALLFLKDWPRNTIRTAQTGPYRNFKWESQASLCLGWRPLIQMNGTQTGVDNANQWAREWKDTSLFSSFQEPRWPRDVGTDLATLPLDFWVPETLAATGLKPPEAGFPGCLPGVLTAPDLSVLPAALAQLQRPAVPPFRPAVGTPVKIDVTKLDFGRQIAESKWTDGTTFIAVGFGSRFSSPINVRGKSLRIEFEQTAGAPLSLSPRPVDAARGTARKDEAYITVTGGNLDLVQATFTIPHTDRQFVPDWLIQVTDGDLTLQGCRLHGSLLKANRTGGLIRCSTSPATAPPAGNPPPQTCVIQDSLLVGTGTVLSAEMDNRSILLRNSIVCGRDDLFGLKLPAGAARGAWDADHCTLTAGAAIWRIDTAPGSTPLAAFASNTVFGPPIRQSASGADVVPLLLTMTAKDWDQKRFEWWEDRCGYAPELTRFIQKLPGPAPEEQDFATAWTGAWPPGQCHRPLSGAGGVVLNGALPTRGQLTPEHFSLADAARAATWADGGLPIGAKIADLKAQDATTAAKASPTEKKPTPQPGF